jgi:hypothetical protein
MIINTAVPVRYLGIKHGFDCTVLRLVSADTYTQYYIIQVIDMSKSSIIDRFMNLIGKQKPIYERLEDLNKDIEGEVYPEMGRLHNYKKRVYIIELVS